MAYWLFHGNPKYYRVLDAIRDFDPLYWEEHLCLVHEEARAQEPQIIFSLGLFQPPSGGVS